MLKIATNKAVQAIALLSIVLLFTAGFAIITGREEIEKEGTEEERENPAAAMAQEFIKLRDPHLNIIPTDRLVTALEYYNAPRLYAKTTTGFSSITWTSRGPSNVGGRTRTLLYDKNDLTYKTVFAAGVGGGLWKCTDITAATPVWTVVNDQLANLAITTIAQDTANPQVMYFGTGEGFYNSDAIRGNGIWKSTNGGSTWTQLSATNNNDNFAYVQKIIVTVNGNVYAACRGGVNSATAGGLQKSTNGGTSWTRVIGNTGTGTDLRFADIEEAANGDLYASVGLFTTGRVYKSSVATYGVNVGNSGNWTNITPAGSYRRIELAVAPNSALQVYAICQSNSSNEVSDIFSSNTGGSSWTPRTVPTIYDQGNMPFFTRDQAWYDIACAVDPNNSQTLYLGGVDLLKSTDAGDNWTQLTSWSLYNNASNPLSPFPWLAAQNVHSDMHAFVFKPGTSTTALLGCDGGVFYTSNLTVGVGLPTWTEKNTGYNVTQYYACAAHPTNVNYFLAGSQDNGSHKFNAVGMNSVTEVTGGDGAFCFIDQTNGNNQITSYVYNNYYRSTNGGTSFTDILGGDNTGGFINPADLDNNNDILYSGGDNNTLVRWSNLFASTVRTDLTVSIGGNSVSAVKVSPNTPTTVYLGAGGKVYRVTNANAATPTVASLTSSALVASGNISSIDVVKRTTNTDDSILVTISNYGVNSVYLTTNGTVASPTWTDLDDNSSLQDIPVRWGIFSPTNSKIIFLGTEVGVLATANISGTTTPWTLINNSSLPNVSVHMLKVNSAGELVAATHGRGLWTSASITPLPLQLLSFDARLNNNTVSLEWRVNNDIEAKLYTVERSYNGGGFESIREVTPAGKSLYAITDETYNRAKGTIYYRLKTEDRKGEMQYSPVKTVRLNGQTSFIEQVYPTVIKGLLNIKPGNADVKQMRVQLYDAFGRMQMNTVLPYGFTTVPIQQYAAGEYILMVTAEGGNEKYVSRVIVQ